MIDSVIGVDEADDVSKHVAPHERTFVTIEGHSRRFAHVQKEGVHVLCEVFFLTRRSGVTAISHNSGIESEL